MTDKVRTHLSSIRTDGCLIPGGLTSHLQPADVSWNKLFKSAAGSYTMTGWLPERSPTLQLEI